MLFYVSMINKVIIGGEKQSGKIEDREGINDEVRASNETGC